SIGSIRKVYEEPFVHYGKKLGSLVERNKAQTRSFILMGENVPNHLALGITSTAK
ncbi:unnamed protein product, partial [Sphenostylis stenocarpa]